MGFETTSTNKSMLSNNVKLFTACSAQRCCCPWSQSSCMGKPRYRGTLFRYRGRFWDVPATLFAFPGGVKRKCRMETLARRDARLYNGGENGVIEKQIVVGGNQQQRRRRHCGPHNAFNALSDNDSSK